jgi:hypothetical protein
MHWYRKRYYFLLILFLTSVVSVAGCGRSIPDKSQRTLTDTDGNPKSNTIAVPSTTGSALQRVQHQNQSADTSSWHDPAREDPDPRVRLHAIETWSQKSGDTLDPATHAMVDPDETVRARAQQLFEDALARK